ncbi:hypothetical protein [Staphylococcus phage vB_SurM-PSU4]|nr:hypothetical protein [Staphylococcus phage vB_SurM-PSU4]
MKIKQKKELNLPQLIEWGFNNPELVKGKLYLTKEHDEYSPYVQFSVDGYGVRTSQSINNKDTFTVEVEEVVDSDTVLDNIYTVNVEVGTSHTTYYKSKSIDDVKTDEINIIYTILKEEAIVLWDSQGGFR